MHKDHSHENIFNNNKTKEREEKSRVKEIKKFCQTFAFHHSEIAMNQPIIIFVCFVIVWSRWLIWSCCLHYNVTLQHNTNIIVIIVIVQYVIIEEIKHYLTINLLLLYPVVAENLLAFVTSLVQLLFLIYFFL